MCVFLVFYKHFSYKDDENVSLMDMIMKKKKNDQIFINSSKNCICDPPANQMGSNIISTMHLRTENIAHHMKWMTHVITKTSGRVIVV